ncbi:MAG TPA: hypothetical protein VGA13_01890 [Acidimicrobiales bacterium]|jgi:hypothetical protein
MLPRSSGADSDSVPPRTACEEHQQVRERRQERWDEWKYDQRGDERDDAPRGYESGSQFDIDEFFADL